MKDLVLINNPNLQPMLAQIQANLPAIQKATENFGKKQSQLMDNTMVLSHPTPLRNLRQATAEIESAYLALQETYFKQEKLKVQIKMKKRDIESTTDELQKELLEIEVAELNAGFATSEKYINGAVRRIRNYIEQYNSILNGKEGFSELEFEQEEEKYHIMTAFSQAITAARSKGGIIDEGNHIYLMQLGINGTVAQNEVSRLLVTERDMLANGIEPSHSLIVEFLEHVAQKFKGCSAAYAEQRGISILTKDALLLGDKND